MGPAASAAKALRVALVRKGRVVEERVLAAPVTVGSSPKATFAVPASDLPPALLLFTPGEEGPSLALVPGLEGKVGAQDLSALAASGRARQEKGGAVLPLGLGDAGRLAVGEVTVLFEVVAAPRPRPPAKLPAAAKGNRFRSLDRLFVAILAGSLAVHVAAYAGLAATPVREEVTLEEIPDRFARILIPERRPEQVAEEKKPEAVAEAKPDEPKPEEKAEKPAEAQERTPEQKAARAAAVAKAVQSKGLLKVLGSLGGGPGAGSAVVAVFGGEGGGLGEVAQALSGVAPAVAGDAAALGARRGAVQGGAAGAASIGELATSGRAQVDLGAKSDVAVTGSVAAESAEIDSADVDQGKLASFVKARMAAIKACYEAGLKRNPSLKGKIRIRFTILETGALDEIVAAENGVGSPEVAACIVGTMRSWRTPFRPSGTVTVEYPFVFSAN